MRRQNVIHFVESEKFVFRLWEVIVVWLDLQAPVAQRIEQFPSKE